MTRVDLAAMFVPRWSPLEVVVRAALTYLGLALVFRVFGRRELQKRTTFDVAVVLLVSTALRQTIVGEDTSLTSAMLGLTTLFVLDAAFTALAARSEALSRLLVGLPLEVLRDGRIRPGALRWSGLSRADLEARLREQGAGLDARRAWLLPDGRLRVERGPR
jgi:uncharacterized membrane protein YcaP (DUF421 family)